MKRVLIPIVACVALMSAAGAHDVFGGAPHVTTAISVGGATIELVYQSIELGQGRAFGAMNAGETQQNERRYKFYLMKMRQIGELSTTAPLRIGDLSIPAGKYTMGFFVDPQGNYSVRIGSATDVETEIGRAPIALHDTGSVVPFLVQGFTPSETAGQVKYAVMFGKKAGTLPVAVGP